MMTLALCDDNAVESAYIAAFIRKWGEERKIAVHIKAYESSEQYLFAREDGQPADVLVLDIMMGPMNGMALAQYLRTQGSRVEIIFITGYPDFIAEGYDVSALQYLMKPVDEEKLMRALDKACERRSQRPELVCLTADGNTLCIPAMDIHCVEAYDHLLEITTAQETHRAKMPLNALEQKLGEDFVRVHRGCLVNRRYVRRIGKTAVTLDSGKELPLSRRLYAEVNRAILQYITGEVKS